MLLVMSEKDLYTRWEGEKESLEENMKYEAQHCCHFWNNLIFVNSSFPVSARQEFGRVGGSKTSQNRLKAF